MEECLKRKRKLIFLTGCDKKTPEVSWFFKFSRLHLSILAKSSENLTFFLSIFQKISQKWPISLEFFKKPKTEVDFFWNFEGFKLEFFKFSRYFSKKFEKFALKTLIFQKTRNGSWFFQIFQGFGRYSSKKFWEFDLFWPPQPEIAQLQGFYCVFKWQYFQFWSKKSTFFFFLLFF